MAEEPRESRETLLKKELPEPTRVTVEEVKARLDRGEPIAFLDTRSLGEWEKSDVKIKGAIRVPPKEVDKYLDKIPRNRSIVTYCPLTARSFARPCGADAPVGRLERCSPALRRLRSVAESERDYRAEEMIP